MKRLLPILLLIGCADSDPPPAPLTGTRHVVSRQIIVADWALNKMPCMDSIEFDAGSTVAINGLSLEQFLFRFPQCTVFVNSATLAGVTLEIVCEDAIERTELTLYLQRLILGGFDGTWAVKTTFKHPTGTVPHRYTEQLTLL